MPVGRPPEIERLTPEVLKAIEEDAAGGAMPVDAVMSHVEVSDRTVKKWLKVGRKASRNGDDCPEAKLFHLVTCARAKATAKAQRTTHDKNAEWWLTRVRRSVPADPSRALQLKSGEGESAVELVVYTPSNGRES